jgi:hypothetical protein
MKKPKKNTKRSIKLIPYYQKDESKRISWSAAKLQLAVPANS